LALFLDLTEGVLSPLSTVALAIGTYFSAYISGKLIKEKSLFIGLIIGFIVFIIISIVSAIVSKSSLTLMSLFHFLVTVLSGVIGAIIGVNSANKRKII
jgi:putative membrane protein (TIGR04086 family)